MTHSRAIFFLLCRREECARFLSHKDISEPLSIRACVSTVLLASCFPTLTGTTLRHTFPFPAEVLFACPLRNGVLLSTWVPWSATLALLSIVCCGNGGWSRVWCLLLHPWTSHVLLARHPTAMWPYLKQLWHNWAFLVTCRRSSKFLSTKFLHFTKEWAPLHAGHIAYLVAGNSLV